MVNTKFCICLGPGRTGLTNLFGPTKNLDKICLCEIFYLSSVGALRQSKIFVTHMCQSHETRASIATFEDFSDPAIKHSRRHRWDTYKNKGPKKKALSTTLADIN